MQDNLSNIRQLPQDLLKILNKLIVNRSGSAKDAMMVTRDVPGYVSPQKHYQFTWKASGRGCAIGLIEVQSEQVDCPARLPKEGIIAPKQAVLTGEWVTQESVFNADANILGGMGSLILSSEEAVSIPVLDATPQTLAFYNAYLLSIGSIVQFETKHDLPVVDVSIGQHYVEHFLSNEQYGGGEYIEYHDQPHFWAPSSPDCSGHILLGRQEQDTFYMTGFRIPFGHAIYMSPFTLHSDAYLVGDYLVVYTVADHYSTVIFKKPNGDMGRLQFETN